jgi:hypothetical protein
MIWVKTLSRQALQDRTGLEPIMDVRDSAVNSLHLAGDADRLGQGFSPGARLDGGIGALTSN